MVRIAADTACFARGAHAHRPSSEHPGAASAPNITSEKIMATFLPTPTGSHSTGGSLAALPGHKEIRMRIKYSHPVLLIAMLLGLGFSSRPVFSQAPFYQGKIVRIINNDPGGTAGTRVKTVVPYLRNISREIRPSSWNLSKAAAGAERRIRCSARP